MRPECGPCQEKNKKPALFAGNGVLTAAGQTRGPVDVMDDMDVVDPSIQSIIVHWVHTVHAIGGFLRLYEASAK